MDAQEDEESRMYCNISHADMRQGKTRLVMTSRVKGRIAQFCAKHGISSKSLPDGADCVALMKHIGFFTVDTSVFRIVTTKVLTWIQSNITQAKMSGMLREESSGTEGSRKKDWKIHYAVIATKWIDDDYNPFQSGFGQTGDVQFAPPFLRQSRSLDAAVSSAVDAAADQAGETCMSNAVIRRNSQPGQRISQPEEHDIVMDELYDLEELTISETSLPTSPTPSTAATSPWSSRETPFHRAVAHMMVIANDSTMEQVQVYLNSEQGIKDAIARLFKEDDRTHGEPGSEELVQTREHANALAIENRAMQQRIRDLEHKVFVLADITNQPEYIALECRLRTMEMELLLARKDAAFEKEKLTEELVAAQEALASRPNDPVKSAECLALQQWCQTLEQELATLRSDSTSEMDEPIAKLASAQQALRDPTEAPAYLTVQRQLEISKKTIELAREDAKRQQRTIRDLETQLAALQATEDHLQLKTTNAPADEQPCSPLTEGSNGDYIQMKQQETVVSTRSVFENGSKQHLSCADEEGVLGRKTEAVLDGIDIIDSTTNGHSSISEPDDSNVLALPTQAPAAATGASIHAAATPTTDLVEEEFLATSDLSRCSPSSHLSRALDSTSHDSSAFVPLPVRIQKPVRPSWM